MKRKLQHPTLGEITLSSTLRSVRTTITVRPSGEVRLSFPPYISQQQAIAFLESKQEWVEITKAKLAKRQAPELTPAQIEHLRADAKRVLPQRVEELALQHGLRYGRVTIRAARSKWGSCTSKGNLSLSLYIMTLPPHLQDYIILHELAHTVHHNHSPRFHALVDRLTNGQERQLAKELRKYAIR